MLLAFVVAFAATCVAIGQVAGIYPASSNTRPVYEKIRFLERNLTDYDVVYVGSSRTRRGFKPEAFDAELAALGIRVRSFNLGLPGLHAFAQDYLVRQLLGWDTTNLRLLIVAPDDFDLADEQADSDRQVLWHDLGGTVVALEAIAQTAGGLGTKIGWSWNHLRSFLLNVTTSGRLANHVNSRVQPALHRVLGPRADGYLPNPTGTVRVAENAEAAARVAAVEAVPAARPPDFAIDYVAKLTKLARSHSVPIAFIREPALLPDRSRYLRWLDDEDPEAPIVDLGSPAAHPELFEPELFRNVGHLNDAGASVFSRALAHELAPILGGAP